MTRQERMRPALAGALALCAGAAVADDPQAGRASRDEAPGGAASGRLTGRLEASPGTLLLELGGARVEVLVSRDGDVAREEVPRRDRPDGHEVRASLTVDGRTTSVVLHVSRVDPSSAAPSR